jgi:hypothetical protein
MNQNLNIPRFGKLLKIESRGYVVEVLPNVFCYASEHGAIVDPTPFFERFVHVDNSNPELIYSKQIELAPELFQAALDKLVEGLRLPDDFSPGLDARTSMVGFAALIAAAVHANQFDKLGFPYVEHPRRVFLNSEFSLNPDFVVEQERQVGYQAAWLHDVLEDSADYFYRPIDEEDLLNWGFSKRVVEIVGLLTRNNEVNDSGDYYQRIFIDGTARAVKLADIADNLASWRVALLPPQMRDGLDSKYGNALKELMFSSESETWFEERVGRSSQWIKTDLALSESRKVLERYQFTAENDNHARSFLRNQGGLNTISKLYEQSLEIMNESTWIGREEIPDVMAALDPYSLDVWYGALFLMHSRAHKHQATELWEQVESLANFLDQQSRSEALFFTHFGLVPRNADYSHIKFRYQKADKALVKLLKRFHLAEQQPDAHIFFIETRPLEKYFDRDLFDILLLAWHEASERNSYSLVKSAINEFEHRRSQNKPD